MRHLVTERSNHSSLISIATVPSIVSRCIQITYTNIASYWNTDMYWRGPSCDRIIMLRK